ncbi:HDOD domain-containing protein [Pontibacterium sp. N1Y112]|uniref:HDOD domain-containing protein n=1 Tax=Pontibacterium sinense TaxID=2781979 RepID=A0A8J7K5Q1_9GAMM|nr:HDOD domain-containing protein [Pontibacterium sinense]MBE9397310.1 HDOD domain-containing protein [Pontibacterium sinense]
MNYSDTLRFVYEKLDRLGDLPVFSTTVNRIQQVSSSEESDAMALAMAIMKDANLSAKILKIANSSTYHRGGAAITVVSRAVVLIGFKKIKNICLTLKLVEGFHKSHPDINTPGLLMRAFLNANIASDLAIRSNHVSDAEEAYINALLYGLGEIVIAHTMPSVYRKMLVERKKAELPWRKIQLKMLGGTFSDLGQDLARSWGHPPSVVHAMSVKSEFVEGDHAAQIAGLSYQLLEQLYDLDDHGDHPYGELVDDLGTVTGLDADQIGETALRCYQKVSQMASDYGLSCASMARKYTPSGHEAKDELMRQMAFITAQSGSVDDDAQGVVELDDEQTPSAEQQLDYLHQVTEMINQGEALPTILKTVIEAMAGCTRLDRVQLCLLNRGGTRLEPKMSDGDAIEPLQRYFSRSKDGSNNDMFFRVIARGATLLVSDIDENGWHERIPADFIQQVRCQGFVVAPIVVKERVIGMLYGDRLKGQGALDEQDFKVFSQFASQARLALLNA